MVKRSLRFTAYSFAEQDVRGIAVQDGNPVESLAFVDVGNVARLKTRMVDGEERRLVAAAFADVAEHLLSLKREFAGLAIEADTLLGRFAKLNPCFVPGRLEALSVAPPIVPE